MPANAHSDTVLDLAERFAPAEPSAPISLAEMIIDHREGAALPTMDARKLIELHTQILHVAEHAGDACRWAAAAHCIQRLAQLLDRDADAHPTVVGLTLTALLDELDAAERTFFERTHGWLDNLQMRTAAARADRGAVLPTAVRVAGGEQR